MKLNARSFAIASRLAVENALYFEKLVSNYFCNATDGWIEKNENIEK